jgi:cytochrome c-type biogenesis protein CcmH
MSVPPADASLEVLVAKAEAQLKANPNDGRGWAVLAPIYLRTARFEDSVKAFEMAAKINGQKVAYEVGIGQALIGLNGGQMNDAARAAFKRALKIDPTDPEPKLLLATDLAQQGKLAEAKTAFETILNAAPADAPWRALVVDMIARVEKASLEKAQEPGPTQGDIEAASGMSTADRLTMIEGMVAQLDAKLVENPSDLEGWKRLLRSYSVLNKADKMAESLDRARVGLQSNKAGLTEINALAVELGIAKP